MKILKILGKYVIWIAVALFFGIVYLRLVIGANNVSDEGIGYLFTLFYNWGLFHIGVLIGLVVAILFIFLDIFYLKRKLKNNRLSTVIRLSVLFTITAIVGILHYILEKVIDII